jgi:hypothetical protein
VQGQRVWPCPCMLALASIPAMDCSETKTGKNQTSDSLERPRITPYPHELRVPGSEICRRGPGGCK